MKYWYVVLQHKTIRGPFLHCETAEVAKDFLEEIHCHLGKEPFEVRWSPNPKKLDWKGELTSEQHSGVRQNQTG